MSSSWWNCLGEIRRWGLLETVCYWWLAWAYHSQIAISLSYLCGSDVSSQLLLQCHACLFASRFQTLHCDPRESVFFSNFLFAHYCLIPRPDWTRPALGEEPPIPDIFPDLSTFWVFTYTLCPQDLSFKAAVNVHKPGLCRGNRMLRSSSDPITSHEM